MKTALIISLNFHPGHVSHMVASYKQCEELGYKASYFVNLKFEKYLPENSRILKDGINSCPITDLAIFLFPSQKNLPLIWRMKRKGVKVVYIFHEPLSPMKEYRKAGFSYAYLARLWVVNRISQLTVQWSDAILLPSQKAVTFYENNPLYVNKNYYYIPLMYDDERCEYHSSMPRLYFSYIGTVAADHSFNEFLRFVEWAVTENRLPSVRFLIATKSSFEVPEVLKKNKRVVINQGKPFTDEEINAYYASTICVWNAYSRTTQSGVLAKSFMFGTPALVMCSNLNEFTHNGKNVVALKDNTNMEEIASAIELICQHQDAFSSECRLEFEKSFYYGVYNNQFGKIVID